MFFKCLKMRWKAVEFQYVLYVTESHFRLFFSGIHVSTRCSSEGLCVVFFLLGGKCQGIDINSFRVRCLNGNLRLHGACQANVVVSQYLTHLLAAPQRRHCQRQNIYPLSFSNSDIHDHVFRANEFNTETLPLKHLFWTYHSI